MGRIEKNIKHIMHILLIMFPIPTPSLDRRDMLDMHDKFHSNHPAILLFFTGCLS
jgi:hypothetical protein